MVDRRLGVFMLDVGQGDATVVLPPEGESGVVVFDCRDDAVVTKLLTAWRRTHVHAVIVSHLDWDHIAGVRQLLENPAITVESVYVSVDRDVTDDHPHAQEAKALLDCAKEGRRAKRWELLIAQRDPTPGSAARSTTSLRGAEPLLRPYVESGMKFFVAKVNPKKVLFVDGRAELSPLRFHYDHDRFELPIRLGLANSTGTQDLIVSILAPGQRYEVANYKNVTIPTNLDVDAAVRDRFGAFYASLFDRTIERNPGAVVTEYAWQASTCDPCPGPTLNSNDFMTLGADVLDSAQQIAAPGKAGTPPPSRPAPRRVQPGWGNDFVLTRLHARYGKDIKDDLVFKAAAPIVGGREHVVSNGKLEEGAQPSSVNNFQGRYAIRHRWTGPIACKSPQRNIWGGPPGGGRPTPRPALNLAFAPRGQVQLTTSIKQDVPEIGLRNGKLEPTRTAPAPAPAPVKPAPTPAPKKP